MSRLFILDGSGILYRAHFAFLRNPLITSQGEHTSAVFGFLNTFLYLQREETPDEIVVAFDRKGKTFRHDMYKDYKATRPPQPMELRDQIPRTKEMLDAMGIHHFEMEGMEADDLIGSLAVQAVAAGKEAVIVSADKDFMQLVGPGVRQ
jgi:DNA polymerase-1